MPDRWDLLSAVKWLAFAALLASSSELVRDVLAQLPPDPGTLRIFALCVLAIVVISVHEEGSDFSDGF